MDIKYKMVKVCSVCYPIYKIIQKKLEKETFHKSDYKRIISPKIQLESENLLGEKSNTKKHIRNPSIDQRLSKNKTRGSIRIDKNNLRRKSGTKEILEKGLKKLISGIEDPKIRKSFLHRPSIESQEKLAQLQDSKHRKKMKQAILDQEYRSDRLVLGMQLVSQQFSILQKEKQTEEEKKIRAKLVSKGGVGEIMMKKEIYKCEQLVVKAREKKFEERKKRRDREENFLNLIESPISLNRQNFKSPLEDLNISLVSQKMMEDPDGSLELDVVPLKIDKTVDRMSRNEIVFFLLFLAKR